jgi:hypothetical protein
VGLAQVMGDRDFFLIFFQAWQITRQIPW